MVQTMKIEATFIGTRMVSTVDPRRQTQLKDEKQLKKNNKKIKRKKKNSRYSDSRYVVTRYAVTRFTKSLSLCR